MSALSSSGGEDGWLGRVVDGRYRIVRRLGEGGMGVVFEAEHLKLGKRVALKAIARERIGDAEVAARFTREAMATAQIEHPHIAAGFDYGLLPEGGAYLVAQLVRGTSLHERVSRGPTPWREACVIAEQIADALAAIHRAGYVHRDLTPENVMLAHREDGTPHVYVLDLGVAALLAAAPVAASPSSLTVLGTVVGTPGYMAPEQALGRSVDARADLYVLGVLLWEMIAGRPLFAGRNGLTEIVAAQLVTEPPGPPEPPDGALPFDLEKLLRDLLSPDPERRPGSAAVLRAALARITSGEGAAALARPSTSAESSLLPAAPPAPGASLERALAELPDRVGAALRSREAPRLLAIGLAIGALPALALVLGGLALSSSDPPPTPIAPPPVVAPGTSAPALAAASDPGPHAAAIERMLHSRSHREREQAAASVLDADPTSVPPYARAVAALTIANRCPERAEQLEAIGALGDPRAIPLLERLRDEPTTGCGRRGRFDCYGCLRDRIEPTLEALRRGE